MMTEEDMNEIVRNPAVTGHSHDMRVYFLKDSRIVGIGRISSKYMGDVNINLDDDASKEYFKDDYALKYFGLDNISWVGFRFLAVTGQYVGTYSDEPADRCDGVTIVDKFDFDWGFSSKKRYGHIEGFGGKRGSDDASE